MRFIHFLLANCLNCSHVVPIYCENTWELSECKKFNRYADMCRMDEGKCGKEARHFSPKDVKNIDKNSERLQYSLPNKNPPNV